MPREKEGYREQYAALIERYPGREAISMQEAIELLGTSRDALTAARHFPKCRIGKKIVIPLMALARWLS